MDLYAAFVERGVAWLHKEGILGAITSRAGLFLSTLKRWREEVLLGTAWPVAFVDLGGGVLDTAMVETSAYCLKHTSYRLPSIFYRQLQSDNKAASLSSAVCNTARGKQSDDVFDVNPASFTQVPGTPFAYWVSDRVRRLYTDLPSFEGERRAVRAGLQTSDDDRFLRCWWEVAPISILDGTQCDDWRTDAIRFHEWCQKQTLIGKQWVFHPKGGPYSPFFADIHLVVNWGNDGKEMKEFAEELKLRVSSPPGNGPLRDFPFYFHFGLTWSRRTHRLCLQELPAATIISIRGSGVFADRETLSTWLGLGNSEVVDFLVKIGLGREGHPQFDSGDVKGIPFPELKSSVSAAIGKIGLECLLRRKLEACAQETSPHFIKPALLQCEGMALGERFKNWRELSHRHSLQNVTSQKDLDEFGCAAYGLRPDEIKAMSATLVTSKEDILESADEETHDASDDNRTPATQITEEASLISYFMGIVFGRWDVRKGAIVEPCEQIVCHEPFAPLNACSPGSLTGVDGLPVQSSPLGYPLSIDNGGILIDDPEHHDDVLRRIRDAFEVIWKDSNESIEREVCQILGVKGLRDYFRKPGKGGFWDDHISRYSKSRRKAPIYWLLQSSKKNYALWLYYHRLDKDLLFKALVNYVEPKIRLETSHLQALRNQKNAAGDSGKEAKRVAEEIESQEDFLSELRDFEDKLRRASNLHLVPDLNDGVVLNIAPLHELVPWKEAKKYWEELLKGKYEWSSIGKQLRQKGLVT